MIAQALGGTVEKFDGGWAIGRQDYAFEGHGTIALNAWHQDQVIALAPEAQVIAGNDFCKFAALVYEDKAYTIQPHPEFSNPVFSDYVSARRDSPAYPAALMDRADQTTNIPIQDGLIADDIAAFFKGTFKHEVLE
jgi:GMP synthase-like glutamine amidotransferase